MKKGFQESFDHLKEMINKNIDLLGNLIEQSQKLAAIIKNMPDSGDQKEIKDKLQQTRNEIDTTIQGLMKKTDELFDFYNQLLAKAFS